MEKNATIARIKSCMLMEFVCSTVHHIMAYHYPEEKELWNELALDEESRAGVIANALGLEVESHTGFEVPAELPRVREAVRYASEFREKFLNERMSLSKAVEMEKKLLDLKGEGYDNDILGKEKDERLHEILKRFREMDRANLNLIRTFMVSHGFTVKK